MFVFVAAIYIFDCTCLDSVLYTSARNTVLFVLPTVEAKPLLVPYPYTPALVPSFVLDPFVYHINPPFLSSRNPFTSVRKSDGEYLVKCRLCIIMSVPICRIVCVQPKDNQRETRISNHDLNGV